MSFKGVRLTIIVFALALTLGLLFGGRWLYHSQALSRPLEDAVRAVPGVDAVVLGEHGQAFVIQVRLGQTQQLEDMIADLWRAIEAVDAKAPVELRISDTRNQNVENAFYDFHFHLQEAVATGNYSDLPARLAEVAVANRLTYERVYVGAEYVFVQLHQGEAALYEVVPRHIVEPDVMVDGGAGYRSGRTVTSAPWVGEG